MKIKKIERHTYAPELNRIHFENGASIAAPKICSTEQARKELFKQATQYRTFFEVKVTYPKGFECVNKTYTGCYPKKLMIKLLRGLRDKHQMRASDLIDPKGHTGLIQASINVTKVEGRYI